jgi:poly(3-hydroxybutyrate) depolymerase
MIRRILFLLGAILLSPGLIQYAAAQIESRPIEHNNYSRPYLVYRPAHLSAHPAVVFMLGGIHSTAQSESDEYGWKVVADQYNFLVVFPCPVATHPDQPADKNNITFWEMQGSRTHQLASGALPVDDDGYLMAVLHEVERRYQPDRNRIYFAGFSSGSGMVQLLAARHSKQISAIVAVATPLMEPPSKLVRPVAVLYIHGDKDQMFSGFETNSPQFATTPHGNWVTWGYLNHCQKQTAEKTDWGVRFVWTGCRNQVPVEADFVKALGHEWAGGEGSQHKNSEVPPPSLNFAEMAWKFFASVATVHP